MKPSQSESLNPLLGKLFNLFDPLLLEKMSER